MTKETQSDDPFNSAVALYAVAVELLRKGDFAAARDQFDTVLSSIKDEPVLAERSRMYRAVCERRLAPATEVGTTPDELYHRAVMESNRGNPSGAIQLFDQALQQTPNSARILYARASAWALSAKAEAAVNDLRQAIAIEPTIRFQAVNDPDFERIREEPGFIDIIEPTPTGV
jgi:tetratricopeptide (TPR) repeat protein